MLTKESESIAMVQEVQRVMNIAQMVHDNMDERVKLVHRLAKALVAIDKRKVRYG